MRFRPQINRSSALCLKESYYSESQTQVPTPTPSPVSWEGVGVGMPCVNRVANESEKKQTARLRVAGRGLTCQQCLNFVPKTRLRVVDV